MDAPNNPEPLESFKVGTDRVAFYGELVIIDAAREMPDWKLREFARKPIYFRSKKYALRSKSAAEQPYALRYVLEPWPADFAEPSRAFFTYDEETVRHRDAAHRHEFVGGVAHKILLPLYPLLGFLWSGRKEKLAHIGFEPRSVTAASIMVTFLFVLLELVFLVVLLWTSARSGRLMLGGMLRLLWGSPDMQIGGLILPFFWVELAVTVVLTADLLMRYSQLMSHSEEAPWGFLEWLKRK